MRVRQLDVPQKMKKQILVQLMADRIKNKQLLVVDWQVQGEKPATKQAVALLKSAKLVDKKVTLLLSPHDLVTVTSFVNIPNVQILFFDQSNAYDLANSDVWLVLKKDFDAFKDTVGGWQ
jgi:large subunit ribosomal protein L4